MVSADERGRKRKSVREMTIVSKVQTSKVEKGAQKGLLRNATCGNAVAFKAQSMCRFSFSILPQCYVESSAWVCFLFLFSSSVHRESRNCFWSLLAWIGRSRFDRSIAGNCSGERGETEKGCGWRCGGGHRDRGRVQLVSSTTKEKRSETVILFCLERFVLCTERSRYRHGGAPQCCEIPRPPRRSMDLLRCSFTFIFHVCRSRDPAVARAGAIALQIPWSG